MTDNPPNYALGPAPAPTEAMAVTLGRIEVKVGNILEKVSDVQAEVVQHRTAIGILRSDVQQLQSDQRAAVVGLELADKAREETALALEKQTKDAVDKAKDAVDEATRKSASIWSPFAKAFIVIAAAAAVASVIVSYLVARP